jgi:hypothetical protein
VRSAAAVLLSPHGSEAPRFPPPPRASPGEVACDPGLSGLQARKAGSSPKPATIPGRLRPRPWAYPEVTQVGKPLVVCPLIDVSPWEGRRDQLPAGASLKWVVDFDRLRFFTARLKAGTALRICRPCCHQAGDGHRQHVLPGLNALLDRDHYIGRPSGNATREACQVSAEWFLHTPILCTGGPESRPQGFTAARNYPRSLPKTQKNLHLLSGPRAVIL